MKTYKIYTSPGHNTKVIVLIFNNNLSLSQTEVFRYYPLTNEIMSEESNQKTRQQMHSLKTYVVNHYEEQAARVCEDTWMGSDDFFMVLKDLFRRYHLYGSYIK